MSSLAAVYNWGHAVMCMVCLVQCEQLHLVSTKYASPANHPAPTLVPLMLAREQQKRQPDQVNRTNDESSFVLFT